MDRAVRCGVDIEEIGRFNKFIHLPDKVEPFIYRVFTKQEIENNLKFHSLLPFALGFSAKEAMFKALGISWTNSSISWQEIELLMPNSADINQNSIQLSGFAKKYSSEHKIHISQTNMEYDDNCVIFRIICQ